MVDQGDRAYHHLKVLIPKTLDLIARVPDLLRELLPEMVKPFLLVLVSFDCGTAEPCHKGRKSLVLVSLFFYEHVVETVAMFFRLVSGNKVGCKEAYYFLGSLKVLEGVVGLIPWFEVGSGQTRSRTPNHCFTYRFGRVVIRINSETIPDRDSPLTESRFHPVVKFVYLFHSSSWWRVVSWFRGRSREVS